MSVSYGDKGTVDRARPLRERGLGKTFCFQESIVSLENYMLDGRLGERNLNRQTALSINGSTADESSRLHGSETHMLNLSCL